MPPHLSDADIERIALGVVDRTLPKPEWTHAAHFAAALFGSARAAIRTWTPRSANCLAAT